MHGGGSPRRYGGRKREKGGATAKKLVFSESVGRKKIRHQGKNLSASQDREIPVGGG